MYKLIRDLEDLDTVQIDSHRVVFCDTETTLDEGRSSGGLYGKVRLIQLFQRGWNEAVIIDCDFIPLQDVLNLIQPHTLVFHNASYDLNTINLYTSETWLPRHVVDTIYLARIAYHTKTRFGFYECLGHAGVSDELIEGIDKKKEQKSDWSGPLSREQLLYAAIDVLYLSRLYEELKQHTNSTVYKLDITNLEYAVRYSRRGLPIDQVEVNKLIKSFTSKLEPILEELPLNPRSYAKCAEWLGTSNSKDGTLIKLIAEGNGKARLIKDARHCYKSLEYLNRYNRPVIRGFFNPCASLSGRFSCTGGDSFDHANLQQIPVELLRVIKAPKGWRLVYKDYSGLELRMAVAYVGEPTMGRLMKSGADMHTETAKYIFDKDKVSSDERSVAKTFNFGLIYGGGVKTLQETIETKAGVKLTFKEVKELREKWFDMYSFFKEWHAMHKKQMEVYNYVDIETALGRKVRTYQLTDSLNAPIQGSSAEVTKVSLGLLKTKYPSANLVDTIHDANALLQKKEDAEMWGVRLSECMIQAWKYVIKNLADPDIPMPSGYDVDTVWNFK